MYCIVQKFLAHTHRDGSNVLTVVTMILASPPSTIVKALTIPSSKLKNRYTGHFRDIEADTSLSSKFFGKWYGEPKKDTG